MKWSTARYMNRMGEVIDYVDYEVSEDGQVRSLYNGRVLKKRLFDGHYAVQLRINGKKHICFCNRLVLSSFQELPFPGLNWVHVRDGNKVNHHLSNVEWKTRREQLCKTTKNLTNDISW